MAEGLAFEFPEGFLWGTATAAHQVEGGNVNNDWWAWEQIPGKIKDGSRSGAACDHYNRYPQDFDLLRSMGHNAHRFSIEWSRIEPEPGVIDPVAVAHYRDVLETLRRLGITPLVTLHHFTNPLWLAQRGGWAGAESVEAFRRFAHLCATEYGDLVDLWITFNEPNVYTYFGYFMGQWPPESRDVGAGIKVFRNIVRAHAAAYQEIKSSPHGARAMVGIAQHLRVFQAWRRWLPLDRLAAALPDLGFNHWVLRACADGRAGFPLGTRERLPEAAQTLDFVGVNYYGRDMVAFNLAQPANLFAHTFQNPRAEVSEYGWEIYPEGLHAVLTQTWRKYHRPIHITENGVADRSDRLRPKVILSHLAEAGRALRDGVNLRGYMHWSSMDNFEWSEGYKMRFGLAEVDFETQARRPRPSSALYSQIIARNGLTWRELEEHYPQALPYFVGSRLRSASSPS